MGRFVRRETGISPNSLKLSTPHRAGNRCEASTAAGFSRRECLTLLAAGGWALANVPLLAAESQHGEESAAALSAAESLAKLKEGNQRFVEGHSQHTHANREWRDRLVAGQHPFAVIIGCSDSRVPIELIFDQGFGDLFVIRNAGNLAATDVLASVEYAVLHLHTKLVVVMGHDHCGAVTAALQARSLREREPMELQAVLRMIDVAISETDHKVVDDRAVLAAVEANVRWGVRQLKFLAAERGNPAFADVLIAGAVYDLHTGKVRFPN